MVTVFSRIIHYGITNFWRNGLLSTATVAIMTLSLLVFIGLIFANVITNSMITYVQDKIDISVYFKVDASEDQMLAIKNQIESLPEVKRTEYISRDQALEIFKEEHQDDPTITQSLDELKTNPFQASLNIKAYDPNNYGAIADFLNNSELKDSIDRVNYSENQTVIEKLVGLISNVNRIGLTITVILSLIAGLVVFNTIRLVIYSNRDEIGIMRAVGASNSLVRGPYIVEGIVTGAISALLSLLVVFLIFIAVPSVYTRQTYFDITVPGFEMSKYFYGHILALLGYQFLFGIGVAAISSFIAVRRYLRN